MLYNSLTVEVEYDLARPRFKIFAEVKDFLSSCHWWSRQRVTLVCHADVSWASHNLGKGGFFLNAETLWASTAS